MKCFINISGKRNVKTVEARINRKLSSLKKAKVIVFDSGLKLPYYETNPYIKDINKDWSLQIEEGEEKKEEHDKLVEISLFREAELRTRIFSKPEITTILKGFGELNAEVFTSNEANSFLSDVFYSFLREFVIFNPELWQKLIKPAHFNFKFAIVCNFEKDPAIFNLINELKEIYKILGYIPHNLNAPFHKKETVKLKSEIDEHYNNAISDEVIRNLAKKKVEKINDNFKTTLLDYFKKIIKKIAEDLFNLNEFDDFINNIENIDKYRCPTIEERKEFSERILGNIKNMMEKLEKTI